MLNYQSSLESNIVCSSQLMDGQSSTWWLIGTYPNQWVTFDLGVDTTLSMIRVEKMKKHEGCKVGVGG